MAIQNVRIRYVVDDKDILRAEKTLGKLTNEEKNLQEQFDKANKSAKDSFNTIKSESNNLSSTIKGVGGVIAGAFAVSSMLDFAKEVIRVRGEFQKLEAVLTNTLGSSSRAQAVLGDIKNFAATTNFSVLELTDSFVKLANRGFVPTIEELENLADLANSTGKSFDQLSEAILDAQTGEFERLKEFGISASKDGDKVKFAFNGIKTEVDFTTDAIKEYIVSLGDLNGVQGSTEAISKTLAGQVSNLGDAYDSLLNTLGEGTQGVLTEFVATISDVLQKTTQLVKTAEQLGRDQRQASEKQLQNYIDMRIASVQEIEFLKTKDKEYVQEFINNRTAQQDADFKSFASIVQNRKKAAETVIEDLKQQQVLEEQLVLGLSIAETNAIRAKTRERIKAAEEYYATVIEKEKQLSEKSNEIDQKKLDKEYQDALRRLQLQEQNALREGKLENDSKVYLLSIENDYNEKRMALFRKFNQQNLDELKSYQIRTKEIIVETADARAENNVKYAALEAKKVEIAKDSDLQIKLSNLEASRENIKRYQEEVEAYKRAQERKREIANSFIDGVTTLYYTFNENQRIFTQQEIESNNIARRNELAMFEGNKQAQATINAKYDAMDRKLKREQAIRDRDQAIFNIVLSTAEAVTKALPNLILAGVVGGFGAAQLGLVSSRPLPKFKDGVERLEGAGTETSDSILAMLSKGERVVTAKTNREYFPALTAIHNRHIPPEVMNGMVMNYDRIATQREVSVSDDGRMYNELKSMNRKLDNIKNVNVSIDKRGIHAHLEEQYSKTEFINNYVML